MSINFPAAPVNNQTYTNPVTGTSYTYNSSYNSWTLTSNSTTIVISDIPPTNPSPGNLWYYSATGETYVYYVDPNGGQWVSVTSAIPITNVNSLVVGTTITSASLFTNAVTSTSSVTTNNMISGSVNTSFITAGPANTTTAPLTIKTSNLINPTVTGAIEFNGTSFYGTPISTQRGVIPGEQFFSLGSTITTANAGGAQIIGLFSNTGVTLSANTTYKFEAQFILVKITGTTSHTVATMFGGTAGVNYILYSIFEGDSSGTIGTLTNSRYISSNTAANTVITGALGASNQILDIFYTGIVNIGLTGTFIPQYAVSAGPGGSYNIAAGSYFKIYPIGSANNTSNTIIGSWA